MIRKVLKLIIAIAIIAAVFSKVTGKDPAKAADDAIPQQSAKAIEKGPVRQGPEALPPASPEPELPQQEPAVPEPVKQAQAVSEPVQQAPEEPANAPEPAAPESAQQEPAKAPEPETPKEPVQNNPDDMIRQELKDFLISYEEFVDGYCEFFKNYDPNNMSQMLKYLDLVQKSVELSEKADAWEYDLNNAELAYYTEVLLRCESKMLQATLNQ